MSTYELTTDNKVCLIIGMLAGQGESRNFIIASAEQAICTLTGREDIRPTDRAAIVLRVDVALTMSKTYLSEQQMLQERARQ